MSSSVITCPNCQVRLSIVVPKGEDESFSCPACGQVVVVEATLSRASRSSAWLVAVIGAVFLTGAGVTAGFLLTRTAPPDAIAEAPQPISEAPNVQVVSKEQQHQGISRQEA